MVIQAGHLEHVQTRELSNDVADRSFGVVLSKGYASDVPDYFKRENPANHYEAKGRISITLAKPDLTNGVLAVKNLDDLKTEKRPVLIVPYLGKIEKLLVMLGSLIDKYQPLGRRKVLVNTADFLELQERITSFLQNTPLKPEVTEYYKARYTGLVEKANEKSRNVIKSKNK